MVPEVIKSSNQHPLTRGLIMEPINLKAPYLPPNVSNLPLGTFVAA